MVFSGYTIEELRLAAGNRGRGTDRHTDILVDGPYDPR